MANAKWASTFVFVSHITGILGAWLLRFDFRIRNIVVRTPSKDCGIPSGQHLDILCVLH
ncbi:hypothetical protein CIHG_04524 [Coccidioides immitis H538.4]|uniref:Uncharacterized protein n=3 Tax=Coccidioides immitis TaxID=5501 RepID=A0A0J8R473_COCIT|nr:hypothetical protein CIRG_06692 [Coccidioides immitis RMSCC 2394]KMU79904.1 hypothetical protein CISG_08186 [Coccidioides immitis RMSCC 3703]KMU86734.1 hypothetical protein CIHG_04524 [Coccidioides immitis H538.4]